jgi:hypothetical protein
VPGILDDPKARLRGVALMSMLDTGISGRRQWQGSTGDAQRRRDSADRAGAFGIVRTDTGLNATFARHGVARASPWYRSRARYARPCSTSPFRCIGFSTVTLLGGGIDIGFGELPTRWSSTPARL